MMEKIDSTDKRLVRLLAEDARQDAEVLAKRLKLSAATVRRRLKKLLDNQSLRIVGVVDPARFDLALSAVFAFDVTIGDVESALEALSKRPEIRWVSTTTGRYDIIAQGRFPASNDLAEFVEKEIPKIKGIRDSETFICLDSKKRRNYIPIYSLTAENKRI